MRLAASSLLIVLVLVLGASGGAGADETTPCPAGQPIPELVLTDPADPGSVYATHILRVGHKPSGSAGIISLSAPGARIFDDDGRWTLVRDEPGPLTLTAVVVVRDTERLPEEDDYSCTTTQTATIALQAPNRAVFGDFKRPRFIVPARKLYSPSPDFSFTVKPAKVGDDKSPFTVRARASRRLKIPGRGVKAASHEYPLREFDFPEGEGPRCELICPPETSRGFAKSVGVRVDRIGSNSGLGGLKVNVISPTGVFFSRGSDEAFRPTPFGVDVQVLQSGRRIARLRVAARCDSSGQSSRCKFKKISTQR